MDIRGIIPPVATPMQANEDLDLPRLRWFLDHLIAEGVHGVFVLGTNSEFYALDEREKQEVIATAVAHVNRRVPVYAGTGAETTREAVRLTKMAERLGARKARNILDTGAQAVFTGNVGCILQIARHLRQHKPDLWVAHPIDALWASYSGQHPYSR